MLRYKSIEFYNGITETTLSLFGVMCWACLISNKSGWFRLFGVGITW